MIGRRGRAKSAQTTWLTFQPLQAPRRYTSLHAHSLHMLQRLCLDALWATGEIRGKFEGGPKMANARVAPRLADAIWYCNSIISCCIC
eukprot:8916-Heterococcus_DN1.PRE.2